MARPVKILIAEDNPADAELLVRHLRQAGFEPDWQRVDCEEDYLARLPQGFDLVISDYEMPQFSGLRALALLQEKGGDIPFVLISGTIGEETAVAAMKLGASDYLLKNRLGRLGTVITQALEQANLRRERKQAEESLRASEARFRGALETLMEGCQIVGHDWRYLYLNETAARHGQRRREELLGRTMMECYPGFEHSKVCAILRRCMAERTSERIENEFVQPDGTTAWFELSVQPVPEGLFILSLDVTERRAGAIKIREQLAELLRWQEVTRESEERFRQLTETIDEVFWMTDPAKHTMLYVSPAYEKIWGRTCESLCREPMTWSDAIHPADRERVMTAIATKQLSGDYNETYRIVRPDGTLRWIQDRAFPVYDAQGAPFRIAGVAQDVTEKKQLEAQFFRAQRLESIGTLASGIAHDLNNILAPIMMSAPLIRRSRSPQNTEKMLVSIESSAQRGAQLVRQLLTFGRGVEGDKVLLAIAPLVEEMRAIAEQTFPRNITIEARSDPELWPVLGDATQVHQVLLNLCVNARDAMPQGGTLTVAAENRHFDADETATIPGAKPGDYVAIRVADTGTGMTPEIIDKIFDPFFTTKEVGKGTGLGLATVLGLMKSHGGFVTLKSEPGQGSVFEAHFPALPRGSMMKTTAPFAVKSPPGHGEVVLVVDDEENIREAVRGTLVQHGYAVILARDGTEGTARFATAAAEIKLVITDLDMPAMDGAAMIQMIRQMKPDVKFIVSSGLIGQQPTDGRRDELAALGVSAVLDKPYVAEIMLQAVGDVLAGGAPPAPSPPVS